MLNFFNKKRLGTKKRSGKSIYFSLANVRVHFTLHVPLRHSKHLTQWPGNVSKNICSFQKTLLRVGVDTCNTRGNRKTIATAREK